jgi:uncharacterized MAPEG superfamily protein
MKLVLAVGMLRSGAKFKGGRKLSEAPRPVAGRPWGFTPKGERAKRDHVTNEHDTATGLKTPKDE